MKNCTLLHITHYTLHITHYYTLYLIHHTLYTTHCTLHSTFCIHYTLYIIHYALCIMHSTYPYPYPYHHTISVYLLSNQWARPPESNPDCLSNWKEPAKDAPPFAHLVPGGRSKLSHLTSHDFTPDRCRPQWKAAQSSPHPAETWAKCSA